MLSLFWTNRISTTNHLLHNANHQPPSPPPTTFSTTPTTNHLLHNRQHPHRQRTTAFTPTTLTTTTQPHHPQDHHKTSATPPLRQPPTTLTTTTTAFPPRHTVARSLAFVEGKQTTSPPPTTNPARGTRSNDRLKEKVNEKPRFSEENALLLEVSRACWKKGGARRHGYKVWAEERVKVSLVVVEWWR